MAIQSAEDHIDDIIDRINEPVEDELRDKLIAEAAARDDAIRIEERKWLELELYAALPDQLTPEIAAIFARAPSPAQSLAPAAQPDGEQK